MKRALEPSAMSTFRKRKGRKQKRESERLRERRCETEEVRQIKDGKGGSERENAAGESLTERRIDKAE